MRRIPFVPSLSLTFTFTLVALFAAGAVAQAQTPDLFFVPGRNVNTLGPTPAGDNPALIGNPTHKQRTEASCDVSPNNPWVILCANIHYGGIERFGDSWIGLSMSTDGTRTWRDRLMDGFPSAPAGIGAADPIVRTVPGLGLVAYITISRNDSRGTLSLAVLHERNRETGEPYQFFQNRVIGTGTAGRFLDKPAMLAMLDPAGGTIDVGGRAIPRGTVHFTYSVFPGNSGTGHSEIYHVFSRDYGLTWSNPKKLSASLGVNQGTDLAVGGNTVVTAWRQVADTNQPDGIVFARSTDGGLTWGKADVLWQGTGLFFDQDTSAFQFRTRSMPSIVHDGTAFHVFWSARGFAFNPDDARTVMSSSRDGLTWSEPVAVNPQEGRGHQVMPQAAVAGGRIQVDWIDTRRNEPGSFGRYIADYGTDEAGNPVPLDDPANPPKYVYRQSGDVMAAQASVAGSSGSPVPAFSDAQAISRYRFGLVDGTRRQIEFSFLNARMFQKGTVPFHGDYHALASQRYRPSDTTPGAWIRNTAPSTSHAIFYSAFTDNRDVQGYVWAGPAASSFTPAGVTQQGEPGAEVVVPCSASSETTPDTTVWTAGDSPRSRFQNVYAAATFPGLVVASPSGSKPTGTLERAYVVFAQNLTPQDRTYQFAVSNQPPDAMPPGTGRASFRPDDPAVPFTNCADGAECRTLVVTIPRGSSVTRTVYVRSATVRPRIIVAVNEVGTGGQSGSVILNSNPDAPEIEDPDGLDLPPILSDETYQPAILPRQTTTFSTGLLNPDVTPVTVVPDPRIEYPRIEYPRIEYPRIEYPRIEYPRIEYDALGNPRIEYPRIEYPRIEYKAVENPRIEYSALPGGETVGVTEVTWPVTTDGANTVTGMSSQVFVNGNLSGITGAQLLVTVPHFYSVTRSCDGASGVPVTVVENQVVANTVLDRASLAPVFGGPDTVNPAATQPSFFVGPRQVVFVTLRLVGRADAQLASRAGIIVRSQPDTNAVNTDNDAQDGAIDLVPPVIDLGNLAGGVTVEGNATGGANVSVTITATDPSASGPASVPVSCARTSGASGQPTPVATDGTSSFFPLGPSQVTCTATDAAGNDATAGFDVTVADTTPPVITGVPPSFSLAATSSSGAVVTYAAPTATDVVAGPVVVICIPPSGSTFAIGTTTVTCTGSDGNGNTAIATFAVTVLNRAPTFTPPANISVPATSAAGAVVSFAATGSDIEDGSIAAVCTPASGSLFAIGVTPVACTVTDSHGATASGSFTVTVFDVTPPSITVSATPASIWSPNGSFVPVTVSGVATDAGSGVASVRYEVADEYGLVKPGGTVTLSAGGGYSFVVQLQASRLGADKNGRLYTITVTATDAAGLRSSASVAIVAVEHDRSK